MSLLSFILKGPPTCWLKSAMLMLIFMCSCAARLASSFLLACTNGESLMSLVWQ